MAPQKINVKERFSEGEIDLSMSDLQDVPLKEIAVLKKAYSLDLSNNHIRALPSGFATLTHITKLDLSKNLLTELPENFGDLVKLKSLDLYQNQLQYIPLSFGKLKALRWLDLKDNPLVPAIAKVAGPCLDAKQCQSCARDVVSFFSQVQEQIQSDLESREKHRQKQQEINQQKQMDKKAKNKNKDKNKQQQQQIKKENAGSGKESTHQQQKSGKKNKKATQGKKSESKGCSVVACLVALSFFVFSALFVLTSIKCEYTRSVETAVKDLFAKSLDNVPADFKAYGVIAGSYVALAHETTGNVTLFAIDYVKNTDNLVGAYNALGEVIGNLLNKTKEQYKKFVS